MMSTHACKIHFITFPRKYRNKMNAFLQSSFVFLYNGLIIVTLRAFNNETLARYFNRYDRYEHTRGNELVKDVLICDVLNTFSIELR